MITLRKERFHFDTADAAMSKGGFTLIIRDFDAASLANDGSVKVLAEVPGAFTFKRRYAKQTDMLNDYIHYCRNWENSWSLPPEDTPVFDAGQHYQSYPMPDGSLPVIEACVYLHDEAHPDWTHLAAGFPVSLIPPGKHDLILHCDGVRLHVLLDGLLMDENFIYGTIDFSRKDELNAIYPDVFLSVPGIKPRKTVEHETVNKSLQFFTPPGFNAWVGDVVPYEHNGVIHMFYLHDRRHHASKFGTGCHYYGHYASTDLIHWEEQEFVGEIEEQWESCGTGTPFYHNGKYYFAPRLWLHF